MPEYTFGIRVTEVSVYSVYVKADTEQEAKELIAKGEYDGDFESEELLDFVPEFDTAELEGRYIESFHGGRSMDTKMKCLLCGETEWRSNMRFIYKRGFICKEHTED